jgi:2-methylcitrate dehydratase PrpD
VEGNVDGLITSGLAASAAGFAAGLARDGLPAEVLAHAKANVLYDLVCAMTAGERAAPAWSLARGTAPATATLLLDGARVNVEQAAFANACLMHARAQDDTHYPSQTHPGAAVIPAALALGEHTGADGARLVAAIVAGYEVAAAVGEALCEPVVARGLRAASLFGALGSATAGAAVAGLDELRIADAIGLGASFACGLAQTWTDGSDEWSYQLGAAARSGVTAALLARAGVRGAGRALEGAHGFAAAFADSELRVAWPGKEGGRWRITEVIHKPYPACNIVQAPVSATIELVRRHDLALADIEHVRCALHPADWAYPGTVGRGPFAASGGPLMSVPFCVATAVVRRGLPLESLIDSGQPEVRDLVDRIDVVPDASLALLDATIDIETTSGEHLRSAWDGSAASYSWSWAEIVSWARALGAEHGRPYREAIERVIDAAAAIEDAATVSVLAAATIVRR